MQCHLSRYQNKPSEKAEHFITPHETANQQQRAFLSSGTPARTGNSTKQKLRFCFHAAKFSCSQGVKVIKTPVKSWACVTHTVRYDYSVARCGFAADVEVVSFTWVTVRLFKLRVCFLYNVAHSILEWNRICRMGQAVLKSSPVCSVSSTLPAWLDSVWPGAARDFCISTKTCQTAWSCVLNQWRTCPNPHSAIQELLLTTWLQHTSHFL